MCFCLCREKKLLVGSEDYGRDLTGVQNLRKKHKRLEAELENHEPAIQVRLVSLYWLGLPLDYIARFCVANTFKK